MKILQLVSGRRINGAIMHCLLLSKQLAHRGHDVTVMCLQNSWMWRQLTDSSIKRVACNMKRWPSDLSFARTLIRDGQFDLMHSHLSRAHFFGVIQRQLTGVPCVATAQSCHFQLHWRWNDFVIANSTFTENYHARVNRVHSDQMKRIHLFIDLEKFQRVDETVRRRQRTALGVGEQDIVLGVVGDVIPRKGQHVLIEALPDLVKRYPSLRLVIVGQFLNVKTKQPSKYALHLNQEIKKLQLVDRVHWTGVSNKIPGQMAALDICVVPSLAEPLGMVAMEALATRTPVIASNVGGLPEIVEDGVTGLLVKPESPRELVASVSAMIADPQLRARTAEAGYHRVISKFSPDVLTGEIEQVYQAVRNRRAVAA